MLKTQKEIPMDDENDMDLDELIQETELKAARERFAQLEDAGAVWDPNGRFYSLNGTVYDEQGNPL